MDLSEELDLLKLIGTKAGRGKRDTVQVEYVRDLEEGDLLELMEPEFKKTQIRPLAQLRHTHHTLARLIAEGRQLMEVASITGYGYTRLCDLRNHDPAFQELVSYYEAQKNQVYLDVHERLARVGTVAVEVLEERLLDEPERFTNKGLLEIIGTTFDRSVAPSKGQGSHSSGDRPPVTVNVNFVKHEPPGMEPQPRLKELNPTIEQVPS